MKIVFLGNFDVDYTSEYHYMKTLRLLGHEVLPLREAKTTAEQILVRAVEADMFFWVHTHGWETPGITEVLDILKEKGIPTVGYHLDLWLGIERQKQLETDPYWNIQYFFSVDKLMVDLLNNTPGMPKAFFLPAGVYESECYISDNYREEYQHDIVFTGSRNYHREWPYRQQLIDWLEKTYGDRFAHYDHSHVPKMRGAELNDLYANSKIVIGDTLCKDFRYPYYLSDRIFEVTGRGGFIIHPYITGLEDMFNLPEPMSRYDFDTTKTEVVTYPFEEFNYLRYLIDYYLKNDDEREEIRLAGHERTKRGHTYTQRLAYLLKTIEDERKNQNT